MPLGIVGFDLVDTFFDAVKCPANSNETRQKHHGMNMADMVDAPDLWDAADAESEVALPRRRAGQDELQRMGYRPCAHARGVRLPI